MTFAAGGAWMVVCEQLTERGPVAAAAAMDSDELTNMFREAFKERAKIGAPEVA